MDHATFMKPAQILSLLLWLPLLVTGNPPEPLKLEVYYSTVILSPKEASEFPSKTVYRITHFVYLRNVSAAPITLATHSDDWLTQLGGANPYQLDLDLPTSPTGETLAVSPIAYRPITLGPGKLTFLHRFEKCLWDEEPSGADSHVTYSVSKGFGSALGLWSGEIGSQTARSLSEALDERYRPKADGSVSSEPAPGDSPTSRPAGNRQKPMILSGQPTSSSLSMEDLLTDNYLNAVVSAAKTQDVLDRMYGSPVSVTQEAGVMKATYNIAFYDEVLRKKGGRVGFVATFKEGIFTSWNPVTQVNDQAIK